jgi:hypothetical protein
MGENRIDRYQERRAEVSDATTYTTLKNAGAGAILLAAGWLHPRLA